MFPIRVISFIIFVLMLPFVLGTNVKKAISKTSEHDVIATSDQQEDPSKQISATPNAKSKRAWKTRVRKVQKYKNLEERHDAIRRIDSKYRKQFTREGIEKAKETLRGDELYTFLRRAKRFKESRVTSTQKAKRARKAEKDADTYKPIPSAVQAIDIRAANAAALSQLPRRPSFVQKSDQEPSLSGKQGPSAGMKDQQ
ncbi:uncharacterized protein FA14DRAFT_152294 [Meira miltonrushii]|uniref:Uncharacterized protein n=1 Tax=Meira miltonrushii TaxID=1280837 RepID=A0A316VH02_9BASI|nr:uncharacterized protein FA14DRAFT_152294 [Meira miltonrushii]PWN36872.1 hypothetical protein FA14DRAFT_152294 [Meira miltonrushii]